MPVTLLMIVWLLGYFALCECLYQGLTQLAVNPDAFVVRLYGYATILLAFVLFSSVPL